MSVAGIKFQLEAGVWGPVAVHDHDGYEDWSGG